MARFLLLHGAWHGGWCWDRVADILATAGHEVCCPTYTGLADRSAELTAETGLATFVQDVEAALAATDWERFTVVGHSFGGLVATLVADRHHRRIDRIMYLDADIGLDGRSEFDLMPPPIVAARRANLIDVGGVPCFPCPSAEALGIFDPVLGAEVERRLTPHPLKSYEETLRLVGPPGAGLAGDYILCTDPDYGMLDGALAQARDLGLCIHRLPTGHDAMITAPNALARLLQAGVGG